MPLRDLLTGTSLPRQARRSLSVTESAAEREPVDITPGQAVPEPTYQGRDLRLAGLTAAAMAAVVTGALAYAAVFGPDRRPAPVSPPVPAPAVSAPPAVDPSPRVPSAVRQSTAP